MRWVVGSGLLFLSSWISVAFAGEVSHQPAQERVVKEIALQAFFHLAQPWKLKIYEPSGEDAEIGDEPVRVCFVGSVDALTSTPVEQCTSLYVARTERANKPYPLQTLVNTSLEMLPGAAGQPALPGLVVRASYSGGGAGAINGFYIWTARSRGKSDDFQETFHSSVGEAGDQAVLKSGPLAGALVAVDQVYEGDEENMASPARYEITVYAPAPIGYMKVLSFLSEQRYPSNHTGDGLPDAISTLTPIIAHQLRMVYPHGVPALHQ